MAVVKLIKTTQGTYLATSGGGVVGYKSIEEALEKYEETVNRWHRRGYESSMSACLYHIQFQTGFMEISSAEMLAPYLEEPYQPYRLSSISGSAQGIKFKDLPEVEKLWKSSVKPRLISEKTYQVDDVVENR